PASGGPSPKPTGSTIPSPSSPATCLYCRRSRGRRADMVKYFDPAFKVTVNGTTLSADISGEIKGITVTHQINNVDEFSFTLVNKYPQMRWTHKADRELFRIGGAVAIEMGYVNDMHKMIDGEILKLKPSFPD